MGLLGFLQEGPFLKPWNSLSQWGQLWFLTKFSAQEVDPWAIDRPIGNSWSNRLLHSIRLLHVLSALWEVIQGGEVHRAKWIPFVRLGNEGVSLWVPSSYGWDLLRSRLSVRKLTCPKVRLNFLNSFFVLVHGAMTFFRLLIIRNFLDLLKNWVDLWPLNERLLYFKLFQLFWFKNFWSCHHHTIFSLFNRFFDYDIIFHLHLFL